MTNTPESFSRPKTLLFTLIIIGTVLALLETVSYFVLTRFSETGTFDNRILQANFQPMSGWVPPANAKLKTNKPYISKDLYIRTDADGFSETPIHYASATLNIVITGGSTIFGVGSSSNATTVPSLVEKQLHERFGIAAEVYNLGVRGYRSSQEMARLHQFLVSHRPDIVLAVSGRNDVWGAMREPEPEYALLPRHVFENSVPLVRAAERQQPIIMNVAGLLRRVSYFADLSARILARVTQAVSRDSKEKPQSTNPDYAIIPHRAAVSAGNYAAMQALSDIVGAQFYFVLQPTAYTWDAYEFDTPDRKPKEHRKHAAYENAYYDALRRYKDRINLHDFSATMDGKAKAPYIDNCHYSDEGARILASAIVDLISAPAQARAAANTKDNGPK